MNRQEQRFQCQLCEEMLPNPDAMRTHLFRCGNKTKQCPICQKYIRRGIYYYHVNNDCTNPDDEYTYSKNATNDSSNVQSSNIKFVFFILLYSRWFFLVEYNSSNSTVSKCHD